MLTALRTNQDLGGEKPATDRQIYGSLPMIRKTYSVSENLQIFPCQHCSDSGHEMYQAGCLLRCLFFLRRYLMLNKKL